MTYFSLSQCPVQNEAKERQDKLTWKIEVYSKKNGHIKKKKSNLMNIQCHKKTLGEDGVRDMINQRGVNNEISQTGKQRN